MTCNTHRYSQKKSTIKDNLIKKNNNPNNNLTSNKTYKKRKLLSYGNEDIKKMINSNNHKSPKSGNNNINSNSNHLKTLNTIYRSKELNEIQKINSPPSINRKTLNSNNNTNITLTSINTNYNNNKIKICKTSKNFVDKNKNKKKVSKNNFNKDIITISGDKKRKISKFSYKKLDINNLTENQILKEKQVNKNAKGRNYLSPPNNKYIESYTKDYTSANNLPFSVNKNKNSLNNGKIFSNKVMLNNLSYQTINYEQGVYHQRTKSNLIQNNFKKNMNSNPIFSKVIITDSNNAYIKPAIRIKKNDKLFMNRPILIDTNTDSNYENKTSVNNIGLGGKKLSNNNTNSLNNFTINNTNISNEFKNNLINNNNNIKNTNFNKYILDVIKKNKHQHYNSLTGQINPIYSLNQKENILSKNKKKLTKNTKENKNRDILQIALSLFVNENASRNTRNTTNLIKQNTANLNDFNTYYKINNNPPANKNNNNIQKRNYNLNININNEININENNNNTINNSVNSINDMHRLNNKNLSRNKNNKNYINNNSKQKDKDKYIINLKQKKYNVEPPINTNRNTNYQSSKNYNVTENVMTDINNKKQKKLKTRNFGNKNYNNLVTSINNNYINTIILNHNTVDNNRYIDINKMTNKNNNIIKSYHTKSDKNISDLMYHNKKLISLYQNLSKSK